MKFFILVLVLSQSFLYSETNPWALPIFQRIINRKHVSDLVLENRKDHYRVTLLLHDRYPYSHKSRNYFFYLKYNSIQEAHESVNKLDSFLASGKEIKIYLNGSEIKILEFLD